MATSLRHRTTTTVASSLTTDGIPASTPATMAGCRWARSGITRPSSTALRARRSASPGSPGPPGQSLDCLRGFADAHRPCRSGADEALASLPTRRPRDAGDVADSVKLQLTRLDVDVRQCDHRATGAGSSPGWARRRTSLDSREGLAVEHSRCAGRHRSAVNPVPQPVDDDHDDIAIVVGHAARHRRTPFRAGRRRHRAPADAAGSNAAGAGSLTHRRGDSRIPRCRRLLE